MIWQALIGSPEIAETPTFQIFIGQFAPKPFTGFHRTVSDEKGKDLSGAATEHNPNSYLIDFQAYICEHFIRF